MTIDKKYLFKGALSLLAAALCCNGTVRAGGQNSPEAGKYRDKQPELMFRTSADRSAAAISGISGDEAYKTPTSNLTNTLYGHLH